MLSFSLGSCKDDIPGSDNPNIGGITLTLTSGNMETRTNLTSTAATQNVDTVYIALYKGNNDNATFVAAQDFKWDKTENVTSYEKQVRPLQFTDLVSGEYIILAVGLDADSKTTYFTSLEDFKDKLETANTLANAKAIAANAANAASIATSELFAGWNTFTYEPDIENKVEVEMKRRVAGVLCYLTDIPSTITKSDGTFKVTKVLLRLFSDQCNSIALPRKEKSAGDTGLQADFGEGEIAGSDVLMSYDLSNCKDSDSDGLYEISVADGSRLPNTILMGAYMLPIKYSSAENKSTLTLEVLGKKQSDTGDTTEEKETTLQSFPVLQNGLSSGNDAEKYSIYPNYIYHIGQKPDNNSTEGDYPESLAGEKITVTAKKWDNEEVNVEFPTVPVNATMELVNEEGKAYNTDKYIFDCIGMNDETPATFYTIGDRISLEIRPSILKAYWEILIYDVDNPSSNTMLYMKKEGVYTNKYSASETEKNEGVVIPLVMTENLTDAIRTVAIQLNTYDTSGKNIVNMSTIYVKQYNPIKVEGLAFARFNKGSKRNLSTGEVESNGIGYGWGYPPIITNTLIYGISRDDEDDGLANFKYAKDTNYKDNFYNNSAFYVSAYSAFVINDSGVKIYNENSIWYLPAFYEMEKFMERAITNLIECNVNINEKYWTGSTSALYGSWNMFINSDNKIKWDKEDLAGNVGSDRDNVFLIRQARKIE